MPGFRFAIAAVMTVFMALSISACSDNEATQRKAFIDFAAMQHNTRSSPIFMRR